MIKSISQKWRLLSGQDNWKNLLDPLNNDLRRYIIHYGERAQATYDTFNSERVSKYAGSSRYSKKNLFSRVGLENDNPYKYEVVKYLYATASIDVPGSFLLRSLCKDSWCGDSNWMGYVAVATDEGKEILGRRDILIAWRGTILPIEWAKDFDSPLVSASLLVGECGDAKVHKGVLSLYTSSDPASPFNKTSARDQVLVVVKKLVEKFRKEEISITITGHSLGAVLGTLNAADIVANGYNKPKNEAVNEACPVTAFVFGSPRVGDSTFRDVFESMEDLHLLRVRNEPDVAALYPPAVGGYAEVGEQLLLDSRESTYLKSPGDLMSYHDLEAAYLHCLAGIQGKDGEFHLRVKRDIALVNKSTPALKETYKIPSCWWCEKNKGMVQRDDGTWKLDDHEKD